MGDEYEDDPIQTTSPLPPSGDDEYEDLYEDASPPASPLSWGDVAKGAVTNAPHSAKEFASDVVQPFIHPIETGKNLARVGLGAAEYAGIGYGEGHKKYVDALGQFFMDRYGGVENFKRTLATDPVGALGDLSVFLTGGETVLGRAPGIVGRAGKVLGTVNRYVDPIGGAAKVIGKPLAVAGSGASKVIGDWLTGTSGETVKTAARSGYEGGEKAKAFQEHLRGNAEMREPVDDAEKAVNNLLEMRGQQYRDDLAATGADKTVHPRIWNNIADSLTKASKINTFEGVDLSPTTKAFRQEIGQKVFDWYNLPDDRYHTLMGFDALKRQIGNIRKATPYGTPDRAVADTVYMAIRNAIAKTDPRYAKAMEGYEKASDQLQEIKRTLSLNPNATIDTKLRKLQSILRDNVNTSFGRRAELAKYLVDAGAPELMEKLAGQHMKSWAPRGLGKLLGGELAALASAPFTGVGLAPAIGIGLTMAGMSPRLMGEAAYYSGKLARFFPGQRSARAAVQVGRSGLANDPTQQTQPRGPLQIEVTKPPSGIPPKEERQPGQVFMTPRGQMKWTGTGWLHV